MKIQKKCLKLPPTRRWSLSRVSVYIRPIKHPYLGNMLSQAVKALFVQVPNFQKNRRSQKKSKFTHHFSPAPKFLPKPNKLCSKQELPLPRGKCIYSDCEFRSPLLAQDMEPLKLCALAMVGLLSVEPSLQCGPHGCVL